MKKQILMIGIGQLGCAVADQFSKQYHNGNDSIHVWAVDTDSRTLEGIHHARTISMAHPCKLGDILDCLDPDILKTWFPCDRENDCVEYFETLSMNEGSNQWRMKALLAFNYALTQKKFTEPFEQILEDMTAEPSKQTVELYVFASLAGGTGSGLFIPLTLYIKRFLKQTADIDVNAHALLALPDICEELLTAEQRIKAQANAYAALHELDLMNLVATGQETAVSFRIGHPDDPCFGLLYDAQNEEFQTPESMPFGQVHLFRRFPGIRSTTLQIERLSDAAYALCSEPPYQPLQPTDAIYSGIMQSKTVYPLDSIVSYISLRTLFDTASDHWIHFYRRASREFSRMRSEAHSHGKIFDGSAQNIAYAVANTADLLCEKSEDDLALLNRETDANTLSFDHSVRDPSAYLQKLTALIDHELATADSAKIDKITEAVKVSDSNDKHARKCELIGKGKRRKLMIANADTAHRYLQAYYDNGIYAINHTADAFKERLNDRASELSILEGLLKEDGDLLHPVFALVRLCAFYCSLEEEITSYHGRFKGKAHALSTDKIPSWMLAVHTNVHMDNCRYDTGSSDRLERLLKGDHSHVTGSRSDEKLFCYDLMIAYERMKESFRIARMEIALEVIGEWVCTCYAFFTALDSALGELSSDVEIALHSYTGDSGCTYYVGASQAEKRYLLDKYQHFLKDHDTDGDCSDLLEAKFSKDVAALLFGEDHCPDDQDGMETSAYRLLRELAAVAEKQCLDSEFYRDTLNKTNILEVLLAQNGQNGADDPDLALRKAFLAKIMPLQYTLPDSREGYLASQSIVRRVTAIMPASVRAYIEAHPTLFEGASPEKAIDQLMFQAGEYEAVVRFSEQLPSGELWVIREVSRLRLSYIEALEQSSEAPVYFKSYQKALAMRDQQLTELWNPHLVCGLRDDRAHPTLTPPVYADSDRTQS